MPLSIKKKFALNSESNNNKKIFKDVLRRFTEKTQTYEFIIKFNNAIEKTDESSITQAQNPLNSETIDQKERRRFIRKEIKEYADLDLFYNATTSADQTLFPFLIDLFVKSN